MIKLILLVAIVSAKVNFDDYAVGAIDSLRESGKLTHETYLDIKYITDVTKYCQNQIFHNARLSFSDKREWFSQCLYYNLVKLTETTNEKALYYIKVATDIVFPIKNI